MAEIIRPAVKIVQGNLQLLLTYLTGEEIHRQDFYSIDRLDPASNDGYQRILDERRARRLAEHLSEAFEQGYSNIPTTAFLATEKIIDYDPETNTMHLDPDEVCPLVVVDGQHRLEGVRASVELNEDLSKFKLPITIAMNLDPLHQMYHFYVVNSTQKQIDKSLEQRITARFTDNYNLSSMPYLPRELRSKVERGNQSEVTRMVVFLNRDSNSPLRGRIREANDPDPPRGRLNEAPFANILRSHVFSATNPIYGRESFPRMCQIMSNYYAAIQTVFGKVDSEDTAMRNPLIFRTSGIYFFTSLAKWVFSALYNTSNVFSVDSMVEILEEMVNELEDDVRFVADPQWWQPGAGGPSMNRAMANGLVPRFNDALRGVQQSMLPSAQL